jgi:selenide,water dikinase
MGGEPRTALSVLAFPSERLPAEIIHLMLAGAMEIFKEAGVALIGGHSIKDDEIKLGFAITGLIAPAVAAALEKPKAGDALVLTKPLGTGVLAFCRQIGRDYPAGMAAAEVSMSTLNRAAADAMKEAGASACTDITGFGFFSHLLRMLRPAALAAEIFSDALPAFDGALDALRQGVIPGAIERNREYAGAALEIAPGMDEASANLGFDAQTSGGLLIAVPADRLSTLQKSLASRGAGHFVIGKIVDGPPGKILLSPHVKHTLSVPKSIPSIPSQQIDSMKKQTKNSPAQHEACCAEAFQTQGETAPGSAAQSQKAFAALLQSVQGAGALDVKTKELILFALVVASRCEPCFDAHIRKARDLGIPQAELDEAAWCAIALGGAPVKMFYQDCLTRRSA